MIPIVYIHIYQEDNIPRNICIKLIDNGINTI